MSKVRRPSQPFYRKDRDAWVTRINGKQITLAKGKANKRAAVEEFYKLMAQVGREPATKVTVQQVVDYCLRWTKLNREQATFAGYERYLGYFVKSHGNDDACLITPAIIHQWLGIHPGWGPVTRHDAITHIKWAYNLAHKDGLIVVNPVARMENPLPPVVDAELKQEDIDRMFAGIRSKQFLDLMTFIYETGCRVGEARRLEARNMEIGHQVVTLIGKTTNRTRKIRRIYLSDKARQILEALMKEHPQGPLFRNEDGRAWTTSAINCQMIRLRRRTGIGNEVVARMLRKHWITDALERGVPIATVAELAGHQNTKMIENVYSKLSQRHAHLLQAVRSVRPGQPDKDGRGPTMNRDDPSS